MRKIYKYPLEIVDEQLVKLPEDSIILTVRVQRNKVYLWVEVDTTKPLLERIIYTRGTGQPVDDVHGVYLGTYEYFGGELIYHVYIGVWK